MFSSLEPTRLLNIRPMSNRKSGTPHRPETALAHKLLPQPCTPSSSTPRGGGRPNFVRPFGKRDRPLAEPFLEVFEAGDIAEFFLRFVVLQQAALLDDLLLFAENDVHVVGAQPAVDDQRFGEHVLGFFERQPAGGMRSIVRGLPARVRSLPWGCSSRLR